MKEETLLEVLELEKIRMKNNNGYPEVVKKIAQVVILEIEKYFPGLTKNKFDNFGLISKEGSSAQKRIEFIIYIELLKAGVFFMESSPSDVYHQEIV